MRMDIAAEKDYYRVTMFNHKNNFISVFVSFISSVGFLFVFRIAEENRLSFEAK